MSLVPDDASPAVAAFLRRFEKMLRPGQPSFALIVMDEDGQPYRYTHANRTGLTVAGSELLCAAIELEKQDPCACAGCDAWTAKARLALTAMGATLAPVN